MTTSILAGRVALVTGGSRGIGAAIVKRLAADGASVLFTFASAETEAQKVVASVKAGGGQVDTLRADSADPDAIRSAVAAAVERFGRLDILVNNAGVIGVTDIDNFDLAEFDRMYAINVRAPIVATAAAAAHLSAGGRVIMIGSVVADRIGAPGRSGYVMTKAAVAGLTRALARDLGPRDITVNTVQPGPTETDMNPADSPHAERLKAAIPRGRVGEPEEIASLVAYLAGPQSGYINGASLTVDGGYNI